MGWWGSKRTGVAAIVYGWTGEKLRIVASGMKLADDERMHGASILARTLSATIREDEFGNRWQYQSRSDHHSKVACWGILLDLLESCALLRKHVEKGTVVFGINHEMRDFKHNRKKDLDLVLARPRDAGRVRDGNPLGFRGLVERYQIALTVAERKLVASLPDVTEGLVGSVHVALEAKACMTEHVKALPRLYDELNSSHETIHASADDAIAVGFVMVNSADEFISPGRNRLSMAGAPASVKVRKHKQPEVTRRVVQKIEEMPRRTKPGEQGFDALGIVLLECRNDGSPVKLVTEPPAPQPGEIYAYEMMIRRAVQIYEQRFRVV